ncbi:MAG: putative ATP-dependent RNA helicase ddx27 [Marteilia pararefringens]
MTLKNQRVAAKAKNSKTRMNNKRKVNNVENNEVDEIESLFSNNNNILLDAKQSIKDDSKDSADLNKYSSSLNQIFKDQETVKKLKKSDSSVNSEEYFSDMSLSRPILRCLSQIKIFNPSDIQKKCMDHILSGQNVCASSITGSGKTLAFLSPIFERLIHKPDNVKPAIRVLILTPTRELANQIYDLTNDVFCKNLENVTSSILMGGKNNSEFIKKMTDNQSDDILVSTPGKIVELLNHKRFSAFEFLKNIEILVFDEVDRLLEESFADQTNEIFKACSNSQKQILLFSATIDDTVNRFLSDNEKDFESLVKIDLTSSAIFSNKLEQYFIKIKSNSNQERDNFLLYILKSMCPTNCIIFFPTREKTHAMVEFLTLFGFCVNELHGDMDQIDVIEIIQTLISLILQLLETQSS